MVDLETKLTLEADAPAVVDFLKGHNGGCVVDETDAAVYWLTLHPRTVPQETFFVRVRWTTYPHSPPSIAFASGVGGELGQPSDWPSMPGYRPPNDICMAFTAEGYATHPEWVNGPDAWTAQGNPFLRVAQQLQHDLDNRYAGRAG